MKKTLPIQSIDVSLTIFLYKPKLTVNFYPKQNRHSIQNSFQSKLTRFTKVKSYKIVNNKVPTRHSM